MNKINFLTCVFVALFSLSISAQTQEYKVGQVFYVNLPQYMNKTIGLNDVASFQYKNEVKDVYGFIIIDSKEELKLAELNFSSINEFYDHFISDFLKDEENRKISQPIFTKNGDIGFVECDASYFDKNANIEIYYLVGIVETKNNYYKVISWSSAENKNKFKEDFRKIVYSLKD